MKLTIGQRVSDSVAEIVGSWKFIIVQSIILALWIGFNVTHPTSFDAYPFTLLNLVLSFEAAFTAPFIMMSQNRQSTEDRKKADKDYHINLKAEKEIIQLHQKIDSLQNTVIQQLHDKIDSLLTEKKLREELKDVKHE